MNIKLHIPLIIFFLIPSFILLTACQQMPHINNIAKEITTATGGAGGGVTAMIMANKFGLAGHEKYAAIAGGVLLGAYLGNQFGQYLEEQDRKSNAQTTNKALITGRDQSWSNTETQTSGRSEIIETDIMTTKALIPVLKDKVEQVPPLDFIGESYRTNKIANIRSGPGTDYKTVGSLDANDVVNVIGKVQGKSWYMISQDGVGSGFVHADLLKSAPSATLSDNQSSAGTNAAIETKTVDASATCRTIKQTITLADGSEKQEEIKACQGPNGWEVV